MNRTILFTKKIFLALAFLFITSVGFSQSPQIFSSTGSFNTPAGVTSVQVEAWGGGGGGGGTSSKNTSAGGGSGGAYTMNSSIIVVGGATYTVTVGNGGAGGTSGGGGTAGAASWFKSTSTLLAGGGLPGAAAKSGGSLGGVVSNNNIGGTTNFFGGAGSNATSLASGAGGGGAGTTAKGSNASGTTGGTGGAAGGGAGANGNSTNIAGTSGAIIAGGGSGARRTNIGGGNGGAGARGQVIVTWICPTYSLTTTSVATPICKNSTATVSVTSTTGLPTGTYTVTYNLSGNNTATNNTATMTVTSAGSGSFSTSALANSGTTTITISKLSSGGISPNNCSTTLSLNNIATVTTLNGVPSQPSTITGNTSVCPNTSQTYSVTAVTDVAYTWALPSGWVQTAGGTTNSITVTTGNTTGNVTVTPFNACGNGTARSLSVTVTAPLASAGTPLNAFCVGGTSAALGGSISGTATLGIWSDGGIGGTFTNNLGSTPGTAIWTPPTLYSGTATLTLTASGGVCGTTSTASKTQLVDTPTAIAGNDQTVYASLTSGSLEGNVVTSGTGTWTKIAGPGTATFSSVNSETSNATVSIIGLYTFRWTVSNGQCTASFDDMDVTYSSTSKPDYTLFYEDFDTTNGGWSNSTTTNGSWLWTSTFPATVNEIGENSFWRIDNFDDYANNAIIEIESPTYNFTGYENLFFNLDVRYNTEANSDGMRILYSVNGSAYTQLGAVGSGTNWYNSSTVSALGTNGWSNDNASAALAFTPTAGGANRFQKATIQLADATFKNQSNVKFKVQFKSNASVQDNGVAFDNLSIEGNATVAVVSSPIAPAKINQNLSLWFKTNAGISVTDGTALTAWDDQAYDTTRADLINKESVKAIASNAPTFRDNASRNINFNPVIDFNSANNDYMNGKGGFYSQDYFVVVYSNDIINTSVGASGREIPIGGKSATSGFHEDPTGLAFGNATGRYNDEIIAHNIGSYNPSDTSPAPGVDSYGRAYVATTNTYYEPLIINVKTNATGTATEIYKNGIKIDNKTGTTGSTETGTPLNFYEFKNLPFYLGTGRSGISGRASSALNGRLSEIVSYKAPKTVLEQQKIQSYLGLKYGITLHATSSSVTGDTRLNDTNYIDSAGTTIWDNSTNTGYNYDITGIGRDDDSQLNQKQSKSVNSHTSTTFDDDITIGLTDILFTNNLNANTFGTNKTFMVWGNNNGTLAAQTPVTVNISSGITLPDPINTDVNFVSIGRTWKVVETTGNPISSVKVSIPTTMLTNTITPPGDYLMFISSSAAFDPTAEYRIMTVNGANLETTYDFVGTKYITFGYAPEQTFERCIKFNGTTDYLDSGKNLNLNSSFTVSAWINYTTAGRTILSKRNSGFTEGYDLSINASGKAEMSWYVGASKKTITSSVVIPTGKWHHVGVSFDGTTAKIYIDGINKISSNLAGIPTATSQYFLVAAADGVSTTSYFSGSIDEVRVWNVALTEAQFRYVMNQEILSNSLFTNGTIVPNTITLNDISSVPWTNLSVYYPMSTYTYTNAKDISSNNITAALKNLRTVDLQTAPLPYESEVSGNWETIGTWTNSGIQDLPNSTSIEDPTKTIDWNIVSVKLPHTITSIGNKKVLGLFLEPTTNLIATTSGGLQTDGTKIEVSHYLKLDGKIDLVGRSQLVQTEGSDLDVTSAGSIEKDQQGQSNKFNYNYWSAPVSPINTTANNTNYTAGGVLKDGTNPTAPVSINWVTGYDGSTTTPISLAKFWIYKFDNAANLYANWNQIFETGTIPVGQGFTLKGSGAATATQNLTFTGKPNNGTITRSVGATQLLLVGNPYSSALDANSFITDNSGSIDTTTPTSTDGALYFWEHYTGNATHILSGYQGGYAVRNAAAGVPPSSVGIDFINTSGISLRAAPNQYIPVGQAFFVIGNATGGAVTFKNSQRAFFKEDNAASQTMYRIPTKLKGLDHWTDNSDDQIGKDTYKRVRLGFNNYNEVFHRQAVIAFMDDKANSEINEGYDAENIDDVDNDMYLINSDKELIIEGEGYFDEDASYPIGVRSNAEGKVSFVLDGLENFDVNQSIFIYDKSDDTYHNLKDALYEVELPEGSIDDRFYLRFTDKTLSVKDQVYENSIQLDYIRSTSILAIINNSKDNTVNTVSLFNIQGKSISKWDVKDKDQTNIKLLIQSIASGVYIVKLKTLKGIISKKIIIK
ncbi:LamG-like jellyroll fold domain-containing protein [Flavobacterium sp. GB2R13]|uniref:LamG-like jellyroll fold domain-containing protein n=1 Tax=Flavobacterium algoris TaxID=3398733 RepID=UPI003A8980CC